MSDSIDKINSCGYLDVNSDLEPVKSLEEAYSKNRKRTEEFFRENPNLIREQDKASLFSDSYVCQAGTYQRYSLRENKNQLYILSKEKYQNLLERIALIPRCTTEDIVSAPRDHFIPKDELDMLFNYGFRYKGLSLGLYEYFSKHNYCHLIIDVFGKEEPIGVQYMGKLQTEFDALISEKDIFLSSEHFPLEIPESYPANYSDLAEIAAEELRVKESEYFANQKHVVMDNDFDARYHVIELSINDSVLLRHVMSMYGDGRYEYLLPIEKLPHHGTTKFFRKYGISVDAIYYYGPNAVSKLEMIANGNYGEVTEVTRGRCLALAKMIRELRAKQESELNQKTRQPISLNLNRLMPALQKVFPNLDVKQALDSAQRRSESAGAKSLRSQDEQLDADEKSIEYIPWRGLLYDDEIKLFYLIAERAAMLSSPAYYTREDLNGIDPKDSPSDYFICNIAGESNQGNSCLVRRHQAWEGVIGTLIAIRDNCTDPSQLVRLDELILEAERLEERILKFSGPEKTRESQWASYGAFGYNMLGGIVGGAISGILTSAAISWWKNRNKKNNNNDDSDPPGVRDQAGEIKNVSPAPLASGGEARRAGEFYWDLLPEFPINMDLISKLGPLAVAAGAAKLIKARPGLVLGSSAVGVGIFLHSNEANAKEIEIHNQESQLEGNRFILDKNVCLHELAKNASDTPALGQETVKISTGYCGIDEVKTYLEERGEEETVKKLEEAQVWMSDQTEGVENFARSLIDL